MLVLHDVHKRYDGQDLDAVAGVSLSVPAGAFVALVGPSGCGKSTLLHLAGAMDRPTRGRVTLADADLSRLADDELTMVRRRQIGFVFQFFNLLPTLTLAENIALPLLLGGMAPDQAGEAARRVGARMGITARLEAYPSQVSGGEMQRAAIARAVVHNPLLVIADEPTGNLDSVNGRGVLELLQELNAGGLTVLLATHDPEIAAGAGRIVRMRDGQIDDGKDGAPSRPPIDVNPTTRSAVPTR
jgi:putative ABC transport system ATP-binding protein